MTKNSRTSQGALRKNWTTTQDVPRTGRRSEIRAKPSTTPAAVPELVYMSAQVWSEQVNVPEMMVVLLVCYVAIVGLINQFMQWLEQRLRVPGFGQ